MSNTDMHNKTERPAPIAPNLFDSKTVKVPEAIVANKYRNVLYLIFSLTYSRVAAISSVSVMSVGINKHNVIQYESL